MPTGVSQISGSHLRKTLLGGGWKSRRRLTMLLPVALLACGASTRPVLGVTSGSRDPEVAASPLSRLTFSWLNPTLRLGSVRPLEEEDLPPLQPADGACDATNRFERQWGMLSAIGANAQPNAAAIALWRCFGRKFASAGVVKLVSDACQLACTLLLRHIIGLLESGASIRAGLHSTLALFLVSALQALSMRHYFAQLFRLGLTLRGSLSGATYRKLLRLSPTARLTTSAGEVTNLIGPDAQRIGDLVPYLHALWFAPLQVVAALCLLYREVGMALLPGVCVVLAMLAANKRIAAATFLRQAGLLRARDARVALVRELLASIKVIKLHGWELAFGNRVSGARSNEIAASAALVRLRSLLAAVFTCTPALVAVAILSSHVLLGQPLTLRTAMTVLSAVSLLRSPLLFLPLVLQSSQEARSSLSRVQAFLQLPEARVLSPGPLADAGILFDGADLAWEIEQASTAVAATDGDDPGADGTDGGMGGGGAWPSSRSAVLRDVQLSGRCGELIGIVGAVGSGKTTLLAALTGAVVPRRGSVHVRGSVAFAAQRPYVLSASVRENILFGREYDAARYKAVIDACALASDLEQLAEGDLTQIGERGLAISGGQRSRIALARAAYSNAQVVLLDDPLAAVDGAVASHLMEHAIGPLFLPPAPTLTLTPTPTPTLPATPTMSVGLTLIRSARSTCGPAGLDGDQLPTDPN